MLYTMYLYNTRDINQKYWELSRNNNFHHSIICSGNIYRFNHFQHEE